MTSRPYAGQALRFVAFLSGTMTLGSLRRQLEGERHSLVDEIEFMFEDPWREAPGSLTLDPMAVAGDDNMRRWALRWLMWLELQEDPSTTALVGSPDRAHKSLFAALFVRNPAHPFRTVEELNAAIVHAAPLLEALLANTPLEGWVPAKDASDLLDL
ncbi:MAG: hypothetical protein U0353_06950 [Sandaracinus sp.]